MLKENGESIQRKPANHVAENSICNKKIIEEDLKSTNVDNLRINQHVKCKIIDSNDIIDVWIISK